MKLKYTIVAAMLLLLTACSGARISSEIYLVDIDEISVDEGMNVNVMIGLPISSQDDCAESTQRYNDVFAESSGFKHMEFVRCYTDGNSNLAEYELEVPMRIADPYESTMQGTFEIVRYDETQSGNRNLYIRSKPSALCNLNRLIRDEFYRSLDLSDASPRVVITNDFREAQTLILNQVFANGAPIVLPTEFVLERRDILDVVLSDVTAAWVFDKSCDVSSRTALVAIWLVDA